MSACVTCSREIPAGAAFCAHCGSPNPDLKDRSAAALDAAALRARLQAALGEAFVVEEELGEGGFAVVFAAFDRRLSRRIAVKVLRPELTATASGKQRFVREAESVAKLNHPHILPIFFVGEGEGLVYFGMPLVDGETLDARLRREGRLAEAEAVRIAAEVADALAEAHAVGLVHRDIKPANVMLQGTRARVLVTDFGIAKAAAGSGETLTGRGVAIGSPHYMSPEQAAGDARVDQRSDLYSLGILLWQMLAGSLPFQSDVSAAVLMQQVTKDLPRLRERRPGVSPALEAIVERCTRKDPAERFATAEELALALRAARIRAAPSARRLRPWIVAAAGAAALLLVGAGALLLRGGVSVRSLPAPGNADVSPAGLEVSPVARPVIAVLPFAVVTGGDTAQFSRSVALILSEALALRNGVSTVDANQLLGRWIAEQRRVTAPLDSNAGFAYSLGANQMVIGNYVESGRTFRLSAAMYDTRSAAPLWRDEVTGPTDSLFPLVDRLASRAAVALCGQPDYNPSNLCFDTPARTTEPLAVTGRAGAEADPVRMLVHVAPDGTPSDVRIQEAPADEDLTFQALAAVNAARYQPARKAGRAVEAWTEVAVAVRPPGAAADLALTARCDDPAFGVRNADRACFDTRPVPQDRLPVIRVPAVCGGSATPATVLARVSASGTVEGRPQVKAGSSCAAFDDSAASAVAQIGFAPAIKDGRPVPAWTLVLVRPLPDGFGGTE